MYKYIFLIAIFISSCSHDFSPSSQYTFIYKDIHSIEAKNGFEVFFDSGATKKVKDYYTIGSIIINGSYFGLTESGFYFPAGYWEEAGKPIVISGIGIETHPIYTDPNITHFVGMTGSTIDIFPNQDYHSSKNTYDYMFQAGPLVLSGNILQSFGDSWHASQSHERTLLGKTQSGKIYFFLFEKPISLREVGEKILQDDRFRIDPLTLLNLDGGPSTAYYDGKNGFRENEKLPILFRINGE